jgi:hypothetical protein
MFAIAKPYSRVIKIETVDTLEAVKIAANNEADLYMNGKIVFSPLGFSEEENQRQLEKLGITTYVSGPYIRYKYTDESKNINRFYATFHEFDWGGKPNLQVFIHDYRTSKNDEEFSSVEEIVEAVKKRYSHLPTDAVSVGLFDDNGYTSISIS